jgi:hypothetical protein
MIERPHYRGGINIAMKVPIHQFDATVDFYGGILALERLERPGPSIAFRYGPNVLWIDPVEHLSQAEIWLELEVDDTQAAAEHLATEQVVRRDEIEPLPEGFDGFWISSPASTIHLVAGAED